MKKIFKFLMASSIVALMFVSCEKVDDFDGLLLIGKWESDGLYYRYMSNGSGYSWDEGEDVMEEEAQGFTWTLEQSVLTHIHIMEIGGNIPKVYTVTELTSLRLSYEDDFKSFSFTKVNE